MTKHYFIRFPFTQRQTTSIFLPLKFLAELRCFISLGLTMILVGKAARIVLMFFCHHSAHICSANNRTVSNRLAELWSKLLTKQDGNLPLDFLEALGLKSPTSEEVKQTPSIVLWRSWTSWIHGMDSLRCFASCQLSKFHSLVGCLPHLKSISWSVCL